MSFCKILLYVVYVQYDPCKISQIFIYSHSINFTTNTMTGWNIHSKITTVFSFHIKFYLILFKCTKILRIKVRKKRCVGGGGYFFLLKLASVSLYIGEKFLLSCLISVVDLLILLNCLFLLLNWTNFISYSHKIYFPS